MPKEEKIEDYQSDQLLKVSAALKALRLENGYPNYEHLAYDIGMSRSQYGAYENGQNMTFNTLIKILNHFDMTVFDFFEYITTINTEEKNVNTKRSNTNTG